MVNSYREIWKAIENNQYSKARFNKYLKYIRLLEINIVTIRINWEINKLENIYL